MTDLKLSSEEFRKNLFQTFQNRGVLEALKSQLRNRLITELQQTADGVCVTESSPVFTENLCQLAANSLVAEHLKRCKYDYSLSVFLPESGLRKDKLLALRDILHLLKIGADSQLFKKLERLSMEEKSFKGLLLELMSHLVSSSGLEKTSKAVQVSLQHESSVEDKLQHVEKQYVANLQKENLNWSHQAEKRLLKLQKQWEEKKKEQLEEELQHLKLTEVARVRLELNENHQKQIQQIRKQLEKDFAVKAEKLRASEKEMTLVLQNQKQQHEEQAHSQRQKLLQDMLSLKEREADFDLKHQMETRSLQLDEERIKALTEELKLKRSLLEDAEASYQKRLDDEIQRHKLKCEEEFRDRRRELELKEKRFQQEKDNFEGTKLMYMSCSDELQATKEKLHQLQIQLQNNKTSLASAMQDKEITTKRFNEDYEGVKKREVMLSKENATIQRKLFESEEMQQENQRIINELTKKSSESSSELHRLRDEVKRIKAEHKSKEKSWKEYKSKMECRVQEECEQSTKYQQLYQELATSRRDLDQELADLKLTLQHTQQVLDMELGRNLASDLPCVESMLGNATSSSVHEHVSPPERVDNTMDETSGTAEMIAQSKALFTRLEREAKDLEESYQKFQSRIKHMELDLYPTLAASASMDSQLPNQSLLAQSALD